MKFLLLFVKVVFMCLFIRTDVHSVKLEHKISRNRLISGLYGSSSISLQRDMEGDDMNVVQKEKHRSDSRHNIPFIRNDKD